MKQRIYIQPDFRLRIDALFKQNEKYFSKKFGIFGVFSVVDSRKNFS